MPDTLTVNEVDTRNPYPGLRSFEPSEAHLFFGRERHVDELLRRLRVNRFLTVLGNSGSGKSSLIKCGLIPRLEKGFAAQGGGAWTRVILRPGNNPLGNLATQLAHATVRAQGQYMDPSLPAAIEQTLRNSSLGLANAINDYNITPNGNTIIVVDQFEELFRLVRQDSGESMTFINLLLNAHRQKSLPIYIVLTMRSDFLGHCTEYRGLPEVINDGQYLIPRMKREEIKLAITRPAEMHKSVISSRLAIRLLTEVGESHDQLPILQHALMRTWDAWVRKGQLEYPLDNEHYDSVGTMRNALSLHAEEAWRDLGKPEKEYIAQKIFKTITEKSSESQGISRATRVKDLVTIIRAFQQAAGKPLCSRQDVIEVIETFRRPGRSFLEVSNENESDDLEDDSYVSISHESLMRVWGRLARWVEEETNSAELYRRLSLAATLYFSGKSGLWRNPELEIAQNWYKQNHPNEHWARRYSPDFNAAIQFLSKSQMVYDAELRTQEAERRSKIDRARLIARAAIAVGVVLLLFAGISLWFFVKANRASNDALEKEKLANMQRQEAQIKGQLAAINSYIALENERVASQKEKYAESQRIFAISSLNKAKEEQRKAESLSTKLKDETQKLKATSSELQAKTNLLEKQKGELELSQSQAVRSAAEANRLKELSAAQVLSIKSQQEDNKALKVLLAQEAYAKNKKNNGNEYDPYIYDALYQATKGVQSNFNKLASIHKGAIGSLIPYGSKQQVVSTGSDGNVVLWTPSDDDRYRPDFLAAYAAGTTRFVTAVSNAGKGWMVVAGNQPVIEMISFGDAENKKYPFSGREVMALATLSSGKGFVAAGADGSLQYCNMTDFKQMDTPGERINVLGSANRKDIVFGGTNTGLYRWDFKSNGDIVRTQLAMLNGSSRTVTSIAVSQDDRWLAAGTANGMVFIYDLKNEKGSYKYYLKYHDAQVNALAFNNTNTNQLVSGSLDLTANLIDLSKVDASSYQPIKLKDFQTWVTAVAFTNDGSRIMTGCYDGSVKFFDAKSEDLQSRLCTKISAPDAKVKVRKSDVTEFEKYLNGSVPYYFITCPNIPVYED